MMRDYEASHVCCVCITLLCCLHTLYHFIVQLHDAETVQLMVVHPFSTTLSVLKSSLFMFIIYTYQLLFILWFTDLIQVITYLHQYDCSSSTYISAKSWLINTFTPTLHLIKSINVKGPEFLICHLASFLSPNVSISMTLPVSSNTILANIANIKKDCKGIFSFSCPHLLFSLSFRLDPPTLFFYFTLHTLLCPLFLNISPCSPKKAFTHTYFFFQTNLDSPTPAAFLTLSLGKSESKFLKNVPDLNDPIFISLSSTFTFSLNKPIVSVPSLF